MGPTREADCSLNHKPEKSTDASLGKRLREVRVRNQWRISDVSRMSGLAASTISKVENGRMSLTYDKLQQLAKGLSLDLGELFGARSDSGASASTVARRSFGRSGDGLFVSAGFYDYYYLNADLAPKRMVPIRGVVKARSLEEFGELIRHDGEEFTLVIEGSIILHLEFYAPITLSVGDHVYIDSRMGHAYLAGEDGPCKMISICTGAQSEDIQRAVQQRPTPLPDAAQITTRARRTVRTSQPPSQKRVKART